MSVTKTMTVGRPKLPHGKKKVQWSMTLDSDMPDAIRRVAPHGNRNAWIRNVIREALAK
jgi:hypothetical protein